MPPALRARASIAGRSCPRPRAARIAIPARAALCRVRRRRRSRWGEGLRTWILGLMLNLHLHSRSGEACSVASATGDRLLPSVLRVAAAASHSRRSRRVEAGRHIFPALGGSGDRVGRAASWAVYLSSEKARRNRRVCCEGNTAAVGVPRSRRFRGRSTMRVKLLSRRLKESLHRNLSRRAVSR